MPSWRRVPFLVSVILVAVATLWSSGCCTLNCCETRGHNQVVLLGAEPPGVSEDYPVISQKAKNHITWVSSTGKPVRIIFRLKDGQLPPFDDMECNEESHTCELKCPVSPVCTSGKINDALHPPPEGIRYEYDWSFRSPSEGKGGDPGIIIKK